MPHVNSSGSEDFFSNDEVKVYKDEGEEEKRSSENLSEDKLGLVTETEEGKGSFTGSDKSEGPRQDDGKPVQPQGDRNVGPFGYSISPYPCPPNGAIPPATMGGKLPHMPPFGIVPVVCNDSFSSPPPAHSGPAFTVDPKTGLPRPHIYHHPYAAPPGQFPPLLYNPDGQWQQRPGYPITSGASYHQLASPISRYPAGLFPPPGIPHPGLPHSALIPTGPKQEGISQPHTPDSHRHLHDDHIRESTTLAHHDQEAEKKRPHIKKPLNAFMLFMKEMRAKVVADCTLKESAAINQILGKKWHALDRSEQAKYYEMARKEKELHQQLYPGWSARDNYASHLKKKKRKKDQSEKGMLSCEAASMDFGAPGGECSNPKKCRARFGMEKQTQWCKPCRRKKKCIRYFRDEDGEDPSCTDDENSDSCNDGDCVHDCDSFLGSPAHSSHSEDIFLNHSKSRHPKVESPLLCEMSEDLSDLDVTKKSDVNKSAPKSPPRGKENRDNFSVSSLTVPVTSAKPQKNNFSISSLAVSSVKSEKGQYDYVLTPPTLPPTPYSGLVSPFHPPPFLGSPYVSSAYGIYTSTPCRSYSISSLTSASVKSAPNSHSNSGDSSLISTSSDAESRVHVPRSPRHTILKKSP